MSDDLDLDTLDALDKAVSKGASLARAEQRRLIALARRGLMVEDGIDPDAFGLVCYERDAALARCAALSEALGELGEVVGYIVLTSQPDKTWQPDWDGHLHVDRAGAAVELALATRALGMEYVRLVEVRTVELTKGWARVCMERET